MAVGTPGRERYARRIASRGKRLVQCRWLRRGVGKNGRRKAEALIQTGREGSHTYAKFVRKYQFLVKGRSRAIFDTRAPVVPLSTARLCHWEMGFTTMSLPSM